MFMQADPTAPVTPHTLTLTAGFALIAGVFLMPLVETAYWSHVAMGCLGALTLVVVGAMRRSRVWRGVHYA